MDQVSKQLGGSLSAIAHLRIVFVPQIMIGVGLNRREKIPDTTFRPTGMKICLSVLDDGVGFVFPTVVLEVSYHHESFEVLEQELAEWIEPTTSIQVAIGIKIFDRRTDGSRSMMALLYWRATAPAIPPVEFGLVNPAGLKLSFPFQELFWNAPRTPELAAALAITPPIQIEIDLALVREVIEEFLVESHLIFVL